MPEPLEVDVRCYGALSEQRSLQSYTRDRLAFQLPTARKVLGKVLVQFRDVPLGQEPEKSPVYCQITARVMNKADVVFSERATRATAHEALDVALVALAARLAGYSSEEAVVTNSTEPDGYGTGLWELL